MNRNNWYLTFRNYLFTFKIIVNYVIIMIWIDLYHYSIPLYYIICWHFNYNIYISSYWIRPNGYYKMCIWNFCQEFNMLHISRFLSVYLVFLMIYVWNVLFKSNSVDFHRLPVEITLLKRIYRVRFINKSFKIQDTLMEIIKYCKRTS